MSPPTQRRFEYRRGMICGLTIYRFRGWEWILNEFER